MSYVRLVRVVLSRDAYDVLVIYAYCCSCDFATFVLLVMVCRSFYARRRGNVKFNCNYYTVIYWSGCAALCAATGCPVLCALVNMLFGGSH